MPLRGANKDASRTVHEERVLMLMHVCIASEPRAAVPMLLKRDRRFALPLELLPLGPK